MQLNDIVQVTVNQLFGRLLRRALGAGNVPSCVEIRSAGVAV